MILGGRGEEVLEKRNEKLDPYMQLRLPTNPSMTMRPSKANSHYHPHRPYTLPSTSRLI